jgi:hypothetical protein
MNTNTKAFHRLMKKKKFNPVWRARQSLKGHKKTKSGSRASKTTSCFEEAQTDLLHWQSIGAEGTAALQTEKISNGKGSPGQRRPRREGNACRRGESILRSPSHP